MIALLAPPIFQAQLRCDRCPNTVTRVGHAPSQTDADRLIRDLAADQGWTRDWSSAYLANGWTPDDLCRPCSPPERRR